MKFEGAQRLRTRPPLMLSDWPQRIKPSGPGVTNDLYLDKSPRGSRTVTLGAFTFDYHHCIVDWRKWLTAGVPAPGSENEKPLQK